MYDPNNPPEPVLYLRTKRFSPDNIATSLADMFTALSTKEIDTIFRALEAVPQWDPEGRYGLRDRASALIAKLVEAEHG